jgi:hypothetical protein
MSPKLLSTVRSNASSQFLPHVSVVNRDRLMRPRLNTPKPREIIALVLSKDAESEETQEHANSSAWRCTHKDCSTPKSHRERSLATTPGSPVLVSRPLVFELLVIQEPAM